MRKAVALVLVLGFAGTAFGQHEPTLDVANNNVSDSTSLQRGAKYFVNYCLGCHSAKYVRYNRLGEDLQLSELQLRDNLMFTGEQPFDFMANAMNPDDSERWFTVAPPDLSLIARSRGTDYLYTYLRSFYVAPDRPTGVNNVVMPNTNMPHVLWQLQGTQRAVFQADEHGVQVFEGFEAVTPGELDADGYNDVVRDIVNFLDYIGEPIKRQRQQLGIRVIGFLLVFLLIAYMLKKEIWKDVK
jgi:ubiquinol-cytochrome c reductase cytochrome c1 subunit